MVPGSFLILDVFAERPFGGNQLAVFPDARGLSTETMHSLAREFNFAETTFVLPANDRRHTRLVRIFTPRIELPFAGHPTLGTAAALAHEGLVSWNGNVADVILEEKAGPVHVAITRNSDSFFCEMSLERPLDAPEESPDRMAVAAALSIDEASIRDAWFAGLGVPFCCVELANRRIVDGAVLDRQAWKQRLAQAWSAQLFFFSKEPGAEGRLYARMFAPAVGVDEDPATGSAAAALVASLAERGASRDRAASQEVRLALHIEQGVAMGRPSHIYASATSSLGQTTRVRVGGSCRMFASGTLLVP
jgi:trans-2,3-dihydro-3-hydroxyanthranilate isomerase